MSLDPRVDWCEVCSQHLALESQKYTCPVCLDERMHVRVRGGGKDDAGDGEGKGRVD